MELLREQRELHRELVVVRAVVLENAVEGDGDGAHLETYGEERGGGEGASEGGWEEERGRQTVTIGRAS